MSQIPTITALRLTGSADREQLPLLVLGPSLGTSAATLWRGCAAHLTDAFDVLAWDLPGHGHNRAVAEEPFDLAGLAAGVLRVVDDVLEQRGDRGGSFGYAGDSVGGAVGLQLCLDAPDRVDGAVLCCTGAKIGTADAWAERVAQVRSGGTASLVDATVGRWFAPGFLDRDPDTGSALLHALQQADDAGYAQVCDALAGFDVRDRLGEVRVPVVAVAGAHDPVTPPDLLAEIADGVPDGRLVVLPDSSHLAPAEQPAEVSRVVRDLLLDEVEPEPAQPSRSDAGLAVRREVLGDAHVDRAQAGTTDFTRPFQELITEYAWGSIWTRPGLDRRSRSLVTLTALVAGGHHEELAMHVRAAIRNGLTVEEVQECLLQTAIYCGVPAANTAFRLAQQTLTEEGLA